MNCGQTDIVGGFLAAKSMHFICHCRLHVLVFSAVRLLSHAIINACQEWSRAEGSFWTSEDNV